MENNQELFKTRHLSNEVKEDTDMLIILEGEGQRNLKEISVMEGPIDSEHSEVRINLMNELRANLKIAAEYSQKSQESLITVPECNIKNECLVSDISGNPTIIEEGGQYKNNESKVIEYSIDAKQLGVQTCLMDELKAKFKIASESLLPVPKYVTRSQCSEPRIEKEPPMPEDYVKRHTQETSSLFSELLQLKKVQLKSYEISDSKNYYTN